MRVEIEFRITGNERQTKNGIKDIIALSDGGPSAGAERESMCRMSFP